MALSLTRPARAAGSGLGRSIRPARYSWPWGQRGKSAVGASAAWGKGGVAHSRPCRPSLPACPTRGCASRGSARTRRSRWAGRPSRETARRALCERVSFPLLPRRTLYTRRGRRLTVNDRLVRVTAVSPSPLPSSHRRRTYHSTSSMSMASTPLLLASCTPAACFATSASFSMTSGSGPCSLQSSWSFMVEWADTRMRIQASGPASCFRHPSGPCVVGSTACTPAANRASIIDHRAVESTAAQGTQRAALASMYYGALGSHLCKPWRPVTAYPQPRHAASRVLDSAKFR